MAIKNIVFDVGNVLVRWDPEFIVSKAFPEEDNHPVLAKQIFKHQIWFDLNLGRITEREAIDHYQSQLGYEKFQLEQMMHIVKESLIMIPDSIALMKMLQQKEFELYALTDNTKEIMAYLKAQYDFWPMFKGIVISAYVGHLKPSKEIYHHLLSTYNLIPHETIFIDDHLPNVEGAKAVGIQAIHFQNPKQASDELQKIIHN